MLIEGPCLSHYAEEAADMITTDANKTGLGITLWQKLEDGNIKSDSVRNKILNNTENNYSIGGEELLAGARGLKQFRFRL